MRKTRTQTRNRMYVLSFMFLALIFCTQAHAQGPQDCSDLFVSELYMEKNPNLDPETQMQRPFDLNYAVEIFNPTTTPVDLMQYSLELTVGSSVTVIPLSGSLPGGSVYVLANSNSDLNLQIMADSLTPYLDFESATILTLKHNSTILDKLGQDGIPTADSFDMSQFMMNPYGYLSTKHIDLNDFQNIDMRRGMLVTHGDDSFTSATDIVGNWGYFPNSDRSDIGHYFGLCNNTLSTDIFGFNLASTTLHANAPTVKDPLDLQVNYSPGGSAFGSGNLEIAEASGTSAHIGSPSCGNYSSAELEWDVTTPTYATPCAGYWFQFTSGTTSHPKAKISANYNFSSKRSPCILTLVSHASDVTIDFARATHTIKINSGVSATTVNGEENSVILRDNATTGNLSLTSTANYHYYICDMLGKRIAEGTVSTDTKSISTSQLSGGMYIIRFVSPENGSLVKKFTKL